MNALKVTKVTQQFFPFFNARVGVLGHLTGNSENGLQIRVSYRTRWKLLHFLLKRTNLVSVFFLISVFLEVELVCISFYFP